MAEQTGTENNIEVIDPEKIAIVEQEKPVQSEPKTAKKRGRKPSKKDDVNVAPKADNKSASKRGRKPKKIAETTEKATEENKPVKENGKKRGRKPKKAIEQTNIIAENDTANKPKRGRKPKKVVETISNETPKKRGRKPKATAESTEIAIPAKRGRKSKLSAKVNDSVKEPAKKRGRKPKKIVEAVSDKIAKESAEQPAKRRGRKPSIKKEEIHQPKTEAKKRGRKPKAVSAEIAVSEKTAKKDRKTSVPRNEIVKYLNSLFTDLKIQDYSYNGLQFEGNPLVSKIVAGVDANNIFFIEAAERGAQMAIVHHGLFWKGAEWTKLDRLNIETAKTLMAANLNLYAMHLPLDAHPEFGNNVMIAKAIGAKVIGTFGNGKGPDIACIAQLPKAIKIETLLETIEKKIGKISVHMPFGKSKVKNIGICSGGGASYVNSQNVYDGEIDVLLTGEALHQQVAACVQREIHIIAAGHYNTEVFGVKELVKLVAEHFGIEYEFIDLPTGL